VPNVLYVVHNHPAVMPGGAETYALELYEAMRDSGRYDPLLLALLRQFLSDEALDLMPAWMLEEKKEEKQEPAKEEKPAEPVAPPTPEERARGMLAMSEEQRIETLWEAGVELIKELITLKRFDVVLDLVKCIVEHASNCAVPILHKAGEVARETHATAHWWNNQGKTPVVLLSFDILHDPNDHSM